MQLSLVETSVQFNPYRWTIALITGEHSQAWNSFSSGQRQTNSMEAERVFAIGNLDEPDTKAIVKGETNFFSGWVLISDGTGVGKVEVLYDDNLIDSCEHGLQRDDVFREYPHRPDAKYSGFAGNVHVPQRPVKPLDIVVWDKLGRRHDFVRVCYDEQSTLIDQQFFSKSADLASTLFPTVNREIHPKCEMYKYARAQLGSDKLATEYYFHSAEFLVNNMLKFFDDESIDLGEKDLLDFASGYGRFTRYFVNVFKKVTISDLDQEMLDFNKDQLGAGGFLSRLDSEKTANKQPRKYDVVFCFSFFTHLNEQVWTDWFKKLFGLVSEDGYLIISTHGYKLFEKLAPDQFGKPEQQSSEFVFWGANETLGRLDPNYYGTNIIKDSFVDKVISQMKNICISKKFEMGDFDLHHNIYIFKKKAERYDSIL